MKKITLLASLLACTFLVNAQRLTAFVGSNEGSSSGTSNLIRKSTPAVVNDFQQSTIFTAYPNPFKDSLRIQSIGQDDFGYVLYDITGKPVLSGNCSGVSKSDINTSGLSRGIYILSFTAQGKTQHIKVVKD